MNRKISGNDEVEVLSIARVHGYVKYKVDDTLQQDRDEEIFIKLISIFFKYSCESHFSKIIKEKDIE